MIIQFNAFDKNSSSSHSRTVTVSTQEELEKEWGEFEAEVNAIFFKWYHDNDIVESTSEEDSWADELDLV